MQGLNTLYRSASDMPILAVIQHTIPSAPFPFPPSASAAEPHPHLMLHYTSFVCMQCCGLLQHMTAAHFTKNCCIHHRKPALIPCCMYNKETATLPTNTLVDTAREATYMSGMRRPA